MALVEQTHRRNQFAHPDTHEQRLARSQEESERDARERVNVTIATSIESNVTEFLNIKIGVAMTMLCRDRDDMALFIFFSSISIMLR